MAKVIKPAGQSASDSRARRMHGSTHEHKLQVLNGKDRKFEKPGGKLIMANDNVRSRGPGGPGRQREDGGRG